jgi:hypothetical protein
MSSGQPRSWFSMINESVHTSDDQDIGNVHAISRYFLVVKRGIIQVHYYYIPVNKIEGWDGHVLWLKVTEDEAKNNYRRDKTPDSSTYYMSEYPDYSLTAPSDFSFPSPLPLIPLKLSEFEKEATKSPAGNVPRVYNCPLCNEIFQTNEDLGKHVEQAAH